MATENCAEGEKEEEEEGGSSREGSDGSDTSSNGIDPVQGHGGDEGLPAQIPCCHLDLGPMPDLWPRDPPPAFTDLPSPPLQVPAAAAPPFQMRIDFAAACKVEMQVKVCQ